MSGPLQFLRTRPDEPRVEIPPGALIMVPREANTPRLVREFVGFDAIAAENPDHEVFVLLWKWKDDDGFALVMKQRKDLVHIQGLRPDLVDFETRVTVMWRAGEMPIPERREGSA